MSKEKEYQYEAFRLRTGLNFELAAVDNHFLVPAHLIEFDKDKAVIYHTLRAGTQEYKDAHEKFEADYGQYRISDKKLAQKLFYIRSTITRP